jgi:hypothetical protein
MKYRAPAGLTALSCGGEAIEPDETGAFEAAENLESDLAAHGCVVIPDDEQPIVKHSETRRSRGGPRAEKVN